MMCLKQVTIEYLRVGGGAIRVQFVQYIADLRLPARVITAVNVL